MKYSFFADILIGHQKRCSFHRPGQFLLGFCARLNKPILPVGLFKLFTMIELLIVISIMAILASLLFPALSKARESARGIKCASNLKQLNLSFTMYAGDQDGWYPKMWDGAKEWHRVLCDEGYTNCTRLEAAGYVLDGGAAAGHKTVFWCPSDKRNPTIANPYPQGVSYAQNACVFGDGSASWLSYKKVASIKSPSATLHLTDCWSNFYNGSAYIITYASTERIDYRHNNSANQLFADGHVKLMKEPDVPAGYDSYLNTPYWKGY